LTFDIDIEIDIDHWTNHMNLRLYIWK